MASSDRPDRSESAGADIGPARLRGERWHRIRAANGSSPIWRARPPPSRAGLQGERWRRNGAAHASSPYGELAPARVGPQKRDRSRAQSPWRGQCGPNSARVQGELGRRRGTVLVRSHYGEVKAGQTARDWKENGAARKGTAVVRSRYGEVKAGQTARDCRESGAAEKGSLSCAASMARSRRAKQQPTVLCTTNFETHAAAAPPRGLKRGQVHNARSTNIPTTKNKEAPNKVHPCGASCHQGSFGGLPSAYSLQKRCPASFAPSHGLGVRGLLYEPNASDRMSFFT